MLLLGLSVGPFLTKRNIRALVHFLVTGRRATFAPETYRKADVFALVHCNVTILIAGQASFETWRCGGCCLWTTVESCDSAKEVQTILHNSLPWEYVPATRDPILYGEGIHLVSRQTYHRELTVHRWREQSFDLVVDLDTVTDIGTLEDHSGAVARIFQCEQPQAIRRGPDAPHITSHRV